MVGIVLFHALMFLLGLGIVSRAISEERVGGMLGYLHNTIGISTPRREHVRAIALVWIGSTVVIVDGCLFLLVFITKVLGRG